MSSKIVRQELIDRINNLLDSAFEDGEENFLYMPPLKSRLSLQVDAFDLFVLLNDLCNAKRILDSQSPCDLRFKGRRLGDRNSDAVWVLPDYNWEFPVPNAELEVSYE